MSLYNPNVPQFTSSSLAASQGPILNNFQTLQDVFSVDHIPINTDASTSIYTGNHNIIHLKEQESALQTGNQEISVYSKNVEGQTDQVFIRYQNNGQEFQYTNYQIYSLRPTPIQTSYFTFLPGKIILYFGQFINLGKQKGILDLAPKIATNIISVSTCPIGESLKDGQKLLVDYTVVNGIFTGVIMKPGTISNTAKIDSPYYYLITANI